MTRQLVAIVFGFSSCSDIVVHAAEMLSAKPQGRSGLAAAAFLASPKEWNSTMQARLNNRQYLSYNKVQRAKDAQRVLHKIC